MVYCVRVRSPPTAAPAHVASPLSHLLGDCSPDVANTKNCSKQLEYLVIDNY